MPLKHCGHRSSWLRLSKNRRGEARPQHSHGLSWGSKMFLSFSPIGSFPCPSRSMTHSREAARPDIPLKDRGQRRNTLVAVDLFSELIPDCMGQNAAAAGADQGSHSPAFPAIQEKPQERAPRVLSNRYAVRVVRTFLVSFFNEIQNFQVGRAGEGKHDTPGSLGGHAKFACPALKPDPCRCHQIAPNPGIKKRMKERGRG